MAQAKTTKTKAKTTPRKPRQRSQTDGKSKGSGLGRRNHRKAVRQGLDHEAGRRSHRAKVECTPTGALSLDLALGGGIPKGRVIEIYGPESSGKTTLTLHAIAEVQKAGGTAAFIDAEHALDPGLCQAHRR